MSQLLECVSIIRIEASMKQKNIKKIQTREGLEGSSFLEQVKNSREAYYLILMCAFVVSKIMFMIGWEASISGIAWVVHRIIFAFVMWGSAIYMYSILAEWKRAWERIPLMIGIGLLVFAITALLSRIVTTDSYSAIMGAFFFLMAYGKNYRKILYCFLGIFTATLLTGLIGLPLGITRDIVKPDRAFGGHSLGIIYPNNWGFIVFALLVLIWYLYLRRKRIFTLILFWATAVFMYKYITCLTIAGLAFGFPIVAIAAEFLQDHLRENRDAAEPELSDAKGSIPRRVLSFILIAMPFIVFGCMMLLCWQMDWVHERFYNTRLESMAMRFVEGGYALRLNGFNLLGKPFQQWDASISNYAQEIEMIMDSAYVAYLIIRGALWMLFILAWISFAHYRCIRNMEYRLIVISMFFLVLSLMERPGLDAWYNFILFYPFALKYMNGSDKGSSRHKLLENKSKTCLGNEAEKGNGA